MKRCKVCRKKPKLERRMNCEGIVFCSDECYDLFDDSPNDFKHPYIEDYEAARRIYGDWAAHYEEDLYTNYWRSGSLKKEEMIQDIQESTDLFDTFYALAGSDGVFSKEIYHYLLAFEELQETITSWEMNTRIYRNWVKVWREHIKNKEA
ncbi:hypothetical protein [Planococcus sp. NCCP-2050]|uniref:hypothetical protein n=1 Tax=Planococcus sp. NCCP-2050 TaxID=2944679 RepID=UPI00203B9BC8|nr:hypothetical protein [Planococcus sp. NCCP-2050]GKW45883.1 hypothetical protein NCCP2050_15750 [Planococcus sp. NCCP-2050]